MPREELISTHATHQHYMKNTSAARVGLISITWRTHQQYSYTYYSPVLYEELVSSIDGTHQHYVKNLSAVQMVLISTYKYSSVHMLLISTIKSPPTSATVCYLPFLWFQQFTITNTSYSCVSMYNKSYALEIFNLKYFLEPWALKAFPTQMVTYNTQHQRDNWIKF